MVEIHDSNMGDNLVDEFDAGPSRVETPAFGFPASAQIAEGLHSRLQAQPYS